MTQTSCPSCQGSVSVVAYVCPHCGHPIREEADRQSVIDHQAKWFAEQEEKREAEHAMYAARADRLESLCTGIEWAAETMSNSPDPYGPKKIVDPGVRYPRFGIGAFERRRKVVVLRYSTVTSKSTAHGQIREGGVPLEVFWLAPDGRGATLARSSAKARYRVTGRFNPSDALPDHVLSALRAQA